MLLDFYSIMVYTTIFNLKIYSQCFSNLMFNLKLKDRKIYALNRSHAISLPVVWLETWRGEIGDMVHLEIGQNGELIITPVREVQK